MHGVLTLCSCWLSSFLIGIGVGAEYPCGSVSASEQSEEPGINKKAQHRWFALATSLLQILPLLLPITEISPPRFHDRFRIRYLCICPSSSFLDVNKNVPFQFLPYTDYNLKDLAITTFEQCGVFLLVLVSFLLWPSLFGD